MVPLEIMPSRHQIQAAAAGGIRMLNKVTNAFEVERNIINEVVA